MESYTQLNFITTNAAKVAEFETRLEPLGIKVVQIEQLHNELQTETLQELVEFALTHLDFPPPQPGTVIAIEGAGLFVEALSGFPGVHSNALYDATGAEGLLRLLKPWPEPEQRVADITSVIGLLLPDGTTRLFEGHCQGYVPQEARGFEGFGFDPVFMPIQQAKGQQRTFAQMSTKEKNALSHRGRALEALAAWVKEEQTGEEPPQDPSLGGANNI